MSNRIKSVLVAALAVSAAAPAFAQSRTLYGGGATLPVIAYAGPSFFTSGSRQTNPADAGSLFDAFSQGGFGQSAALVSYCQTGSGLGRRALIGTQVSGNIQNRADGVCGPLAGTPTGFGAPTGYSEPDFAASDAPLSLAEYNTFLNGPYAAAHRAPVQIPAIAGAVAIPYNNPDVTGTLNLTSTQICGIFSGQITDWSSLGQPARPIRVVYRSDGSGTTFSFSNHLTAACQANGPTFNLRTSDTFVNATTGVVATAPAGSIGANGNANVVITVGATAGAIGYSELADAIARNPALNVANVNGQNPRTTLQVPTLTLANDQVLGPVNGNGRPTLLAAPAPTTFAGRNCLVLATPNSYATPAGYPIVAVSYLFAYETANRNLAAVTRLLKAPYTNAVKNNTTTVGPGTGFVFLSGNLSNTVNRCVN